MTLQDALDFLYVLGCQYGISETHMRVLCQQMGVDYSALMNHGIGKPAPATLAI